MIIWQLCRLIFFITFLINHITNGRLSAVKIIFGINAFFFLYFNSKILIKNDSNKLMPISLWYNIFVSTIIFLFVYL